MDLTEIMDSNLVTELKCNICNSLLSTPPILLDQNGYNICGHCKIDSNLKFIHNVCYEILASQFDFPCRFVKEGCTVKKNFVEIELHEERCFHQIVKCDIAKCEWFGRLNEFIQHYCNNHQDLVINLNELKKLENGEGCYILVAAEIYFLIKWKLVNSRFKLYLQNMLYTEDNFFFDFNLYKSNNTSVPVKTLNNIKSNMKAVSFDFHESYEDLSVSFTINSESLITANNIDGNYAQTIICSYCNHQMVLPIWKCPAGHVTCVDCTGYDYDVCKGCDDNGVTFTRAFELEILTLISTYTCKSCAKNCNSSNIQEHEQNCLKRIYECPHCNNWQGVLNDYIFHGKSCSRNYLHALNMTTEVTIGGNDNVCGFQLVAYNELFSIIFEELSLGLNVMISNHGPSSSLGWYDFEAEIYHTVDPNFPFNKIYKNDAHKCYNEYFIQIPNSDIEKFGETRLFQVTVRILRLHGIARSMNTAKTLKLSNIRQ